MSNSRKTIWIIFALFMFLQMGTSYITDKNQDNLAFLMEMKGYISYMLYFSLAGVVLFMLSFMVYQLDNIKSKKQIAQLENDKNELKAKLFDMQEEISKPTNSKPQIPEEVTPKVEEEPPTEPEGASD